MVLSLPSSGAGYRTPFLLKWILNPFVFLIISKLKQIIIKKTNVTNRMSPQFFSLFALLFPLQLIVFVLGIYFYLGEINLNDLLRGRFGLVSRLEIIRYLYFCIWFLTIFKNSFSCTLPTLFLGLHKYFNYFGLICVSPEMVNTFYHMCQHW